MSKARELAELGAEVTVESDGSVGIGIDPPVATHHVKAPNLNGLSKHAAIISDDSNDGNNGGLLINSYLPRFTMNDSSGGGKWWDWTLNQTVLQLGYGSNTNQHLREVGGILSISPDAVVVNEGGQDRDFRVETDADANAFFVDSANNQVRANNVHFGSYGGNAYFRAYKNTGTNFNDFSGVNNANPAWNDPAKAWQFRNNNNCMSIVVGGLANQRAAFIQSGHGDVGYAGVLGSLYLNKLGGTVYANTTSISDRRLKTNIEPVTGALDRVQQLSGYTFYRTDVEPDKKQAGVIAQEVQQVLPEAIVEDDEGNLAVTYDMLSALYIEAIKELKAENAELRSRIEALEAQ